MRLLHLALKDLRQIVRDRKTFLFLLVMPVIFTLMFGFAFSNTGGDQSEDPRLPLLLRDEDNSFLSSRLLDALAQSELVRLEMATPDRSLAEAVAADEAAAALLVPAGFGAGLLGQQSLLALQLVVDPAGDAATPIEQAVQTALLRLQNAVQAGGIAAEIYEQQQEFAGAAARQGYIEETISAALANWETPPVRVARSQAAAAAAEEPLAENPFANTSPGMMAQFAIAGLISAAEILVLERRSRALARLRTTAIRPLEIMAGHFLAMFLMILMQIGLLILFGQLVLGLDYLHAPAATLLLAVAAAAFTGSLGLLIGVLAQTEEQVIIYAMVPMFLLSALGGAWMPLEFTPAAFQQIGRLTPVAWIVDGFKDITIRGLGVEGVLPAVGALTLYTLLLIAVAGWRFEREG